ncbi:MAG: YajQ family cyclic di-GMP-binding protein [Actinomycetota bacterium]
MPSFDVVSQVDVQEVRNAIDQASREVGTRYDFKDTGTKLELGADDITVESSTEDRLKAAVEVLKEKLIRRKVSLRSVSWGNPQQVGGGRYRSVHGLNQGIDADSARQLAKHIRESGLKVQASINGDVVRVNGKKRDDLQDVIESLRTLDYKLPLQYINFRE